MSKGIAGKNNWALFLLLLAGIVLGGFIGSLAAGVPFLSWLNYGQTFGFANQSYWILESWSLHSDSVSRLRSQALLVC